MEREGGRKGGHDLGLERDGILGLGFAFAEEMGLCRGKRGRNNLTRSIRQSFVPYRDTEIAKECVLQQSHF